MRGNRGSKRGGRQSWPVKVGIWLPLGDTTRGRRTAAGNGCLGRPGLVILLDLGRRRETDPLLKRERS